MKLPLTKLGLGVYYIVLLCVQNFNLIITIFFILRKGDSILYFSYIPSHKRIIPFRFTDFIPSPPTPPKFFPQPRNQPNNETPVEKFIPTRLVEHRDETRFQEIERERERLASTDSRKGRVRKTRVCWKEKSRRIPGEFSSTTSQLHRIREEYFIHLPFVRRNREGGTSQPLLTPIPPATDY